MASFLSIKRQPIPGQKPIKLPLRHVQVLLQGVPKRHPKEAISISSSILKSHFQAISMAADTSSRVHVAACTLQGITRTDDGNQRSHEWLTTTPDGESVRLVPSFA
ncbi:hypothetical protein V6N11_070691 [Hibiscus sabdariffa]|uniref:Uncharacterized protein n=1 Tax=Hibiscus sabdariffa TaxID=183260 RepID=A0ABR2QFR6_9ROSI